MQFVKRPAPVLSKMFATNDLTSSFLSVAINIKHCIDYCKMACHNVKKISSCKKGRLQFAISALLTEGILQSHSHF